MRAYMGISKENIVCAEDQVVIEMLRELSVQIAESWDGG